MYAVRWNATVLGKAQYAMDAKRSGLGVEELHELVNAPLGT